MQPSTTFDWGRVVTPLRWVARVVAVIYGGFLGLVALAFIGTLANPSALSSNAVGIALYGILGVGLLVATFWKGIGELVGGLAAVGAVTVIVITQGVGAILFHLPFILAGVLFVACGWYTVAQERHGTTHATA